MKIYVFLFALILSSSAFAFTVTIPEETKDVPVGRTDNISIPIYSATDDQISVTILGSYTWITQSDSIINLKAGESKNLTLFITPPIGSENKYHYIVTLSTQSTKTGEQQRKDISISVNRIELVDVDRITQVADTTPTGQISFTGIIKNYKDHTVENVRVMTIIGSLNSQVVEFEQMIDSIDAGDSKNVSYTVTIPKFSEQGLYSIRMNAITGNETHGKIRTFTVNSLAIPSVEITKSPQIFGFRKTLAATNIGNTPGDVTVTDLLSGIEAAFFSGPEPSSKSNGVFSWTVSNLASGETRIITYSIDFSPAVLIAIAVIAGLYVYFVRIRTVRIKKYIKEKKFIEEGEEFTVNIDIINGSGKKIDRIAVKDFVPSVFNIKEGEGVQPSRKKVATGTELIWNVSELHHNEERVFSYKIIPMFGIHGRIRLPQTSANYKIGKKDVEKKSFFAAIGIEMENYKDKRKIK